MESLEDMGKESNLNGTELYFFTDNLTAENAFFKGSSTSELLHDLVTRLRSLEMMSNRCKIILSHILGERMKWRGTNGLSRGNLLEGVMKGQDMLTYVQLHLTATERSPKLLGWIKSWGYSLDKNVDFEILHPDTWFTCGHDLIGGTVSKNGIYYPQYKRGVYLLVDSPTRSC